MAPKLALQNAEAGTVLFELSILKYRILGQFFYVDRVQIMNIHLGMNQCQHQMADD